MPTRSVFPSQLAIQQAIRELHRLDSEQRRKVVGPLARLFVRESGTGLDVVMINETGREPLLASLEHVLVIAIDLHRVARARVVREYSKHGVRPSADLSRQSSRIGSHQLQGALLQASMAGQPRYSMIASTPKLQADLQDAAGAVARGRSPSGRPSP